MEWFVIGEMMRSRIFAVLTYILVSLLYGGMIFFGYLLSLNNPF
jgi:hypothetical protein